jgi:hypothetical protein
MKSPWKSWTSLHQWTHSSQVVIALPNPSYKMPQTRPCPVSQEVEDSQKRSISSQNNESKLSKPAT